jgi:hypothetical protein
MRYAATHSTEKIGHQFLSLGTHFMAKSISAAADIVK